MSKRKIPNRLPLNTAELKKRRERRRWTQEDLAREMHVNRLTVLDWEAGVRDITPESLYLLSCVLRCTMRDLLPDGWP